MTDGVANDGRRGGAVPVAPSVALCLISNKLFKTSRPLTCYPTSTQYLYRRIGQDIPGRRRSDRGRYGIAPSSRRGPFAAGAAGVTLCALLNRPRAIAEAAGVTLYAFRNRPVVIAEAVAMLVVLCAIFI